jgi:hypothetical protein
MEPLKIEDVTNTFKPEDLKDARVILSKMPEGKAIMSLLFNAWMPPLDPPDLKQVFEVRRPKGLCRCGERIYRIKKHPFEVYRCTKCKAVYPSK